MGRASCGVDIKHVFETSKSGRRVSGRASPDSWKPNAPRTFDRRLGGTWTYG